MDLEWNRLLQWLSEKGMDVSKDRLPVERRKSTGGCGLFVLRPFFPSEVLFRVPAAAMMNIRTLSPLYPSRKLDAVQMVSLHLAVHRGNPSTDPHFGPYISVLPRDFAFHPLTWMAEENIQILSFVPPSAMRALAKMLQRFCSDFRKVSQQTEGINRTDYLWAWLNVNTRCIYQRLKAKQSDPDNFTMCPILDFANHSAHLSHMSPCPSNADRWNVSPRQRFGEDMVFISPADKRLGIDEEIFLKYGAHSNQTLFVEYGFVLPISSDALSCGEVDGEVDVFDFVEPLFTNKANHLQELLERENYWENWTLHLSAGSAYPSFRLLAALRLHHLEWDGISEELLKPWKDTLLGHRNTISTENEETVRQTIVEICRRVVQRGKTYIAAIKEARQSASGWAVDAFTNIETLWTEETLVSREMSESILSGIPF
ncbi:SET domain-containing protein [Guyanagaster necrorhizus]|uniref:SET domain-containing protein n=1 Tax=Guyanagaster necrorhizus TaxID=856835 RepID=A0A9P7W4J2_9AGAR|nr:SET domain-containing protein [Guyanagaster necrorhizus MCA 3950]KAG7452533.1 SET domain-containing protein [Guyanagaster necrorhizus MCA 3950]